MPLETGTYLPDLVAANPAHTDGLNQGDGHLRLIKSVLLATFPNWTDTSGVGGLGALTSTQLQLDNAVKNVVTGTGTQAFLPTGTGISAPGISWAGDPDTGIYKNGEGTLQFVSDGTVIVGMGPAGINANGVPYVGGTGQIAMAGAIWMYQGPSVPTGWAWMNGQTVSSASNPGLTAIYGQSGGNVTLPDWRCYAPCGVDGMGGSSATGRISNWASSGTMNAGIGETTHVLVVGELAQHNHTASDSGHTHTDNGHTHGFTLSSGNTSFWSTGGGGNTSLGGGTTSQENDSLTISTGHASLANGFANITVNNTGSNTGHNTVQLSIMTGFIIKLG